MSAFSDMSGMSTSSGPGVFSMDSGPSLFSPQPSGPAPPVPQQQHEVTGGQFEPDICVKMYLKHALHFIIFFNVILWFLTATKDMKCWTGGKSMQNNEPYPATIPPPPPAHTHSHKKSLYLQIK